MRTAIPVWIQLLVISASIVDPALAWIAFRRGAQRSARQLVLPSAVFAALWVVLAFTLGTRGFFSRGVDDVVPPIAYSLLPLAIGYLAYLTISSVRAVVDEIPLHWMIGFQVYRAVGFVFLVSWMLGALPGAFALPAGLGDVAIGLSAPFVASLVKRGAPSARSAAVLWNVLGIVDLVVAVTMGVLTSPGPLHMFALDAPNVAITAMPFVLVPTIAVPLSILSHLVGLHRLFARRVQPSALGLSRAA